MTNELFFETDCLSAFLWINDTNILEELLNNLKNANSKVKGESYV